MTTATLSQRDLLLREAVVHQLDWDPEVDASGIGVAARDGIVTLAGFIDTYTGKLAAERVAKQVRGVRGVANDIVVRLLVERTDADIARDAADALQLYPGLADKVQVVVHHGVVTLTGTVDWVLHKEQAAFAVKRVRGLLGVINRVTVKPTRGLRNVQRRIVRALHRNADLDARHIEVAVTGDIVTLKGTVGSWTQREAAARAAASAPGIRHVENDIVVEPADLQLEPLEEE